VPNLENFPGSHSKCYVIDGREQYPGATPIPRLELSKAQTPATECTLRTRIAVD